MRSTGKTPIEFLNAYLLRHGISRNSSILIGLSGGPDSVALLSLLSEIAGEQEFSLHCGYLDHGIRDSDEREKDYLFVKDICGTFNVPLITGKIAPGEIERTAAESGRSIEEIARELRYSFLLKTASRNNCCYIALGHNLDDQIETIIMRFFQGSGVSGLRGIPEKRDSFIRPLIDIEKSGIINYLDSIAIPYRMDSTNAETRYLRNGIRLNLVPEIRRNFPGFKTSLLNLHEKMVYAQEFIEDGMKPYSVWEKTEEGFRIRKEIFLAAPPFLRVEMIFKLYDTVYKGKTARLPYRFLRPLLSAVPLSDGQILLDGYGFMLKCGKDFIFWKRVVVLSGKKSYLIEVKTGKNLILPKYYLTAEEKLRGSEDSILLVKEDICYPLIVRSKREGDVIHLTSGAKTLKKIYNQWKVPPSDRWRVPVIEDRNGIAAVFGKPFGFGNSVSKRFSETRSEGGRIKMVLSLKKMER